MKTYTLTILPFILIIAVNHLFAVDWDNYMWEKAPIIAADGTTDFSNSYWFEFFFLPNNPQYGFACGTLGKSAETTNGAFAKTTDSGKTWTASVIDKRRNFHAESIHFVDNNIGYISGPKGLYKTTDGGENWTNIESSIPLIYSFESPWGNFAVDANNVWVLYGNCGTNAQQQFFKSTDGGNHWTPYVVTVSDGNITDLIMYDKDGLGYAVGSNNIWETTNGGISWDTIGLTPSIFWDTKVGASMKATPINWHEDIAIEGKSIVIPFSPGCSGNEGSVVGSAIGALAFTQNMGKSWNTFFYKRFYVWNFYCQ